jgi:hypothetical protein
LRGKVRYSTAAATTAEHGSTTTEPGTIAIGAVEAVSYEPPNFNEV